MTRAWMPLLRGASAGAGDSAIPWKSKPTVDEGRIDRREDTVVEAVLEQLIQMPLATWLRCLPTPSNRRCRSLASAFPRTKRIEGRLTASQDCPRIRSISAPVMDAGFHADQAGSPALEECQHPAAPELTAHHGTFFPPQRSAQTRGTRKPHSACRPCPAFCRRRAACMNGASLVRRTGHRRCPDFRAARYLRLHIRRGSL